MTHSLLTSNGYNLSPTHQELSDELVKILRTSSMQNDDVIKIVKDKLATLNSIPLSFACDVLGKSMNYHFDGISCWKWERYRPTMFKIKDLFLSRLYPQSQDCPPAKVLSSFFKKEGDTQLNALSEKLTAEEKIILKKMSTNVYPDSYRLFYKIDGVCDEDLLIHFKDLVLQNCKLTETDLDKIDIKRIEIDKRMSLCDTICKKLQPTDPRYREDYTDWARYFRTRFNEHCLGDSFVPIKMAKLEDRLELCTNYITTYPWATSYLLKEFSNLELEKTDLQQRLKLCKTIAEICPLGLVYDLDKFGIGETPIQERMELCKFFAEKAPIAFYYAKNSFQLQEFDEYVRFCLFKIMACSNPEIFVNFFSSIAQEFGGLTNFLILCVFHGKELKRVFINHFDSINLSELSLEAKTNFFISIAETEKNYQNVDLYYSPVVKKDETVSLSWKPYDYVSCYKSDSERNFEKQQEKLGEHIDFLSKEILKKLMDVPYMDRPAKCKEIGESGYYIRRFMDRKFYVLFESRNDLTIFLKKDIEERLAFCDQIIDAGDWAAQCLIINLSSFFHENERDFKTLSKLYHKVAELGDLAAVALSHHLRGKKLCQQIDLKTRMELFKKMFSARCSTLIANCFAIVCENAESENFLGELQFFFNLAPPYQVDREKLYAMTYNKKALRQCYLKFGVNGIEHNKNIFDEGLSDILYRNKKHSCAENQVVSFRAFINANSHLHFVIPIIDEIVKEQEPIRSLLLDWIVYASAKIYDLNIDQAKVFEKSGILKLIYKYRNNPNRYAFVDALFLLAIVRPDVLLFNSDIIRSWTGLSKLLLAPSLAFGGLSTTKPSNFSYK